LAKTTVQFSHESKLTMGAENERFSFIDQNLMMPKHTLIGNRYKKFKIKKINFFVMKKFNP
jgi:hypothetical protein